MATIQERVNKDGSRVYRVMVRRKGYPSQSATFDRKTDAKKWAEDTEADIRAGRHFRRAEAQKHTLAELIERYVEEVLHQKRASKRRDQERHLSWWRTEIGARTLVDVTPALLVECRTRLATGKTVRKKKRQPATVNRYLGSLSHALSVASREWGWLESNPARKVSRLKEPRGLVRFLSDEERTRLLEACKESPESRLYGLVLLAISTGARRGEILSLTWPDVDLNNRRAVVHATKNQERRALPLAGSALEYLKKASKVRRIDSDLVFAGDDGRAVFPRKAWEKALRESGIENFRFHDLRHTAASYLAMSGATLAEIAEILGHKTLAMVKRYSHLTEQHTIGVVSRMNEKYLGGGG